MAEEEEGLSKEEAHKSSNNEVVGTSFTTLKTNVTSNMVFPQVTNPNPVTLLIVLPLIMI